MFHLGLLLLLSAFSCVLSESVRETETWMPLKSTHAVAMAMRHHDRLESSGDGQNGSDFGFEDDEDYYETYDDEDEDEMSGSGDGERTQSHDQSAGREMPAPTELDADNRIPEADPPTPPGANEVEMVQNSNEIPLLRNRQDSGPELPSNVLMSHAANDSVFAKTEVLAALIAAGAVGLTLAILLVLLLVHRMKKKDEGSYELGKKPIYKKAPSAEIYA
ncbi:syndecan-4 isoform X3 [Dunckerocampus dactyliophorus]|uniref:syndecan-4 isoform X3 n=1 Tax=Dunckerocampus dactyliophorus TaxID=161453 RepID=UPI002406295D|nr:syndecan-4 isoform X3 [Dunckerocampus dactyliophorus]